MEGMEQATSYPGAGADRAVREGGIEDGFHSLDRAMADLAEALDVHRKAIAPVLKEDRVTDTEDAMARLADAGVSDTTAKLRNLIERVNTMRRGLEETTARVDF